MKIRVAHHIFASMKGYQTQFRSPDVTESENAELESFSFGQTNDASYMASLKRHPAFTVRKLRSGRWAITRVFQGADDDYGRATLRFHTVLVSQEEWASRLDFDVLPFLEHPALWMDTDSTEISVERDDSPLPQDITEKVLSLLNQVTASSSPVIVDESVCSLQTIRWVHRRLLDEEKEKFSYGYRVLSDAMDASLLCLARQALRTTSPGVGRYDTVRVSAPSPFKTPDYKNMNMPYDQPARSNKLAILIIITVCVLGIAGAIFALVAVSNAQHNAQKEKIISEITQPANLFLENNKQFIEDPLKRAKEIKEAEKFIKKIQDLKISDSKLESICKNLETWINKTTQTGELYDKVNNLKERLGNQHLHMVSHPYPIANKIEGVINIEKELRGVLGEFVNEFSSLMFFGNVIKGLEREVWISINKIDSWEADIGNLIIADPNAVEVIENILNKTDPNQYTWPDPNQINFSDPNVPVWTNPKWFPNLAQQDIWTLKNVANQRIPNLLRDRSLVNAMNSPISSHKTLASEYEAKLKRLQDSAKQNIKAMYTLKREAEEIKRIEGSLVRNRFELASFENALSKYEDIIGIKPNAEKVWVVHLRWFILDFYVDNIKPKIEAEEKPVPYDDLRSVKRVYKQIKASSLSSEKVFNSLYRYYEKFKEQEDNKSRQQENRRRNGRNRR